MTRLLFGLLSLVIAEFTWIICQCYRFYDRGYKHGREEGYEIGFEAGRARADNWWLETEHEVEREREKIRNEEKQ
jgi:flagellar biosynthesis/type III secretory pathway protein FliH